MYDRKAELNNCNFVKTVLMLLIVLCHSAAFWTENWFSGDPVFKSVFLSDLSNWLGTFHVYCFCLVSGYIFYYLKFEKCSKKYTDFAVFTKTKIKRLLIPFVFASIFYVIPISAYFFNYSVKDIIIKYVFAVSPSQLWFLIMLFDVFIIFYILSEYVNKHTFIGVIIFLIMYALSVILPHVAVNAFQIINALKFLVFFYIGFIIRKYGLPQLLRKINILAAILLDIIIFIIYNRFGFRNLYFNTAITFFMYLFGAVVMFSSLQKLSGKINADNKYLAFLNKHTMTIYLFHQQIIYFSIRMLNGIVSPYLHCIINFVFSLLVSILISVILHRFKVTRFLIGDRP